jgi:hypothetical protein
VAVVGALLDTAGHAVFPATIELRSSLEETRRAAVASDGSFRFDVPPGEYTALVVDLEPDSGWLAPWGQERRGVLADQPGTTPGFYARLVHLADGDERHELTLTALRAARFGGGVVGPAGEPVEGVLVRLRSRALAELVVDARTDVQGLYAFEGLHPGTYELEARLTRTVDPAYRTLPPPRPIEARLAEGQDLLQPELRLRPGDKEIHGRILDPDGAGLAGIRVIALRLVDADDLAWASGALAEAETEADGSFVLADLPPERVLVCVDPELDGVPSRLADAVAPFEVDVSGEAVSTTVPALAVRERPAETEQP